MNEHRVVPIDATCFWQRKTPPPANKTWDRISLLQ
nr:MAG TPA: hypothetical protein [Caudoviricetes sp.]